MKRIAQTLLSFLLLATIVTVIAGFAGAAHPVFDTASNFRLHLAVGLLILAALLAMTGARRQAITGAVVAMAGIAGCWQGLPVGQEVPPPSGNVHTAFVMNLLWDNREQDKVLSLIARHDPDIVLLSEVSRHWSANLAKLETLYPFHYHCAEWRSLGGNVILSRMKLKKAGFCGPYASLGLATFEMDGFDIDVGVVHLRWPWPASGPRQITAITPKLQQTGPDALIAGDFNSVTWSHSLQRFAQAGNLEIVGGIGATWGPGHHARDRSYWFPAVLGLPIDNVMAKGKVKVISAQRLERSGSDHLPILVKFTVEK